MSDDGLAKEQEQSMMANGPIRARYDALFSRDFMPIIRHEQTQGAEERMAYAAEFGAFQLGQINKSLARLVELMERLSHASAPDSEAPEEKK